MVEVVVTSKTDTPYKQEIKAGGHTLVSDAPSAAGGGETGPEPHELLLASLGACTSITLQMFAKRRGWDLKQVKVNLTEDKVDDPEQAGKQISRITRDVQVEGDLTQEQVDALKVAADKCPIHKLLTGSKQVVTGLSKAR